MPADDLMKAIETIERECDSGDARLAFDWSADDEVWIYGDRDGLLQLAAGMIRMACLANPEKPEEVWRGLHRSVVEGSSLPFIKVTENFHHWTKNPRRRPFTI